MAAVGDVAPHAEDPHEVAVLIAEGTLGHEQRPQPGGGLVGLLACLQPAGGEDPRIALAEPPDNLRRPQLRIGAAHDRVDRGPKQPGGDGVDHQVAAGEVFGEDRVPGAFRDRHEEVATLLQSLLARDLAWRRAGGGRPGTATAGRAAGGRHGSSRGRTRTCDPPVNSRLLYQLSYSGRRAKSSVSPRPSPSRRGSAPRRATASATAARRTTATRRWRRRRLPDRK